MVRVLVLLQGKVRCLFVDMYVVRALVASFFHPHSWRFVNYTYLQGWIENREAINIYSYSGIFPNSAVKIFKYVFDAVS